jgi:hypothetical protein
MNMHHTFLHNLGLYVLGFGHVNKNLHLIVFIVDQRLETLLSDLIRSYHFCDHFPGVQLSAVDRFNHILEISVDVGDGWDKSVGRTNNGKSVDLLAMYFLSPKSMTVMSRETR